MQSVMSTAGLIVGRLCRKADERTDVLGQFGGIPLAEMPHGELTAAPQLIVKMHLGNNFTATLLQATFSPVAIPVFGAGIFCGGGHPGGIHLIQTFPAAAGQCGGEAFDAEFLGHGGCGAQTFSKANTTSSSPFGLVFIATDRFSPGVVIAIAVHKRNPEFFAIAYAFVFAYQIFFFGKNIGVEVKNSGFEVVVQQPFQDGGRAGSTATVQKNAFFHDTRENINKRRRIKSGPSSGKRGLPKKRHHNANRGRRKLLSVSGRFFRIGL